MSTANALQQKIHAAIPLSAAMQFSIEALSLDQIRVSAPLEPNINIHGTGFAGSIYAVAVLAGWALCTHIMEELEMEGDLVVAKADIAYRAPVTAALECKCNVSAAARESFASEFGNAGKAKLLLEIQVGDRPQAVLQATYVALPTKASA